MARDRFGRVPRKSRSGARGAPSIDLSASREAVPAWYLAVHAMDFKMSLRVSLSRRGGRVQYQPATAPAYTRLLNEMIKWRHHREQKRCAPTRAAAKGVDIHVPIQMDIIPIQSPRPQSSMMKTPPSRQKLHQRRRR